MISDIREHEDEQENWNILVDVQYPSVYKVPGQFTYST